MDEREFIEEKKGVGVEERRGYGEGEGEGERGRGREGDEGREGDSCFTNSWEGDWADLRFGWELRE